MTVRFHVPGLPQGKGRPRITTAGGKARSYTPAKTISYEALIGTKAGEALDGRVPFDGPVYLCITAIFPIPASWSKARKIAARWHTSKPDGDNIAKAVGDGCNGVLWRDDSQVAFQKIMKVYGEQPGLDVLVEAI